MRTRQEIKAIGKQQFQANYWPCVGAVFLVVLVICLVGGVLSLPSTIAMLRDGEESASQSFSALSVFITAPLEIGLCYFFVMNILGRTDRISLSTPFTEGFKNYGRKLGGYLWMVLFIFLWSLLLFIPGIVKSLSYAMTPYILADCPNVKAKDALTLSKRIMAGHKGELFVFELSFIGWAILGALTMGLLNIFFVEPYMYSSLACYYLEVREEALRGGVITMGQLEGTEAV